MIHIALLISFQIAVLQDEILRSLRRPNFVTILCQGFEGGSREKMLQQGVQVPEYFLPGVCRIIKLSPSQTVAVCFALMHSQYRSLVQEGLRLLKLKLPEITTVADIGEEIVQALLHFAVNNEVNESFFLCVLRLKLYP
jgi:hypothetical protein